MTVNIKSGRAHGQICAPPSKSAAHRAIICAYLSKSPCRIKNIAYSKDILATLSALEALGAVFKKRADSIELISVDGKCTDFIDCNESGSTLRFLIPICLMTGREITLTGSRRLFERSLEVYGTLCRERGFMFELNGSRVTVCGQLDPGRFVLRADISSQFISGLMFALPQLPGDSELVFKGRTESMPYIELTASVLNSFGVHVQILADRIKIKGGQRYIGGVHTVEGDWSNSAFLEAFNLIGGSVQVTGLDNASVQGDKIFREYFDRIYTGSPSLDISDCPDLGPVLMAMMAARQGGRLTGTHRLKIKESDRGAAMACELAKFGVTCTVRDDDITVGCGILTPTEVLCSHNDHRIVMALAVLCTVSGGKIEGAQAVEKSYPDFFNTLAQLNIETEKDYTDEA